MEVKSMSTIDDNRAVEPLTANHDLIAALREVADWLEQHPGLPRFNAYVGTYPMGKGARAELIALASALGDRAVEKAGSERVTITGEFGPVTVGASASLSSLGARPQPSYAPIITPEESTGRAGEHRRYEVIR